MVWLNLGTHHIPRAEGKLDLRRLRLIGLPLRLAKHPNEPRHVLRPPRAVELQRPRRLHGVSQLGPPQRKGKSGR